MGMLFLLPRNGYLTYMRTYFLWLLSGLILLGGCQESTKSLRPDAQAMPPAWAQDAIWYQVLVERFRNGDLTNDPTLAEVRGFEPRTPDTWALSDWGSDWYAEEPWMEDFESPWFHAKVQLRRYGGDLQGVLDQVDYLDSLGITAVYFNPLNDAPSLHKFDARNWRHIDVHFGPDPAGDRAMMAGENPADPATWQFTSADRLFLEVVQALHARGIRVILDYSFNHTGTQFWAFQDVKERGEASPYSDWYAIEAFDDPATPENEFHYEGWAGIAGLPEMRKQIEDPEQPFPHHGNLASAAVREHVFAVVRRWLDPNGDGDPSDGIDGYRLDVAAEIPLGFWPEFRQVVRAVNPEAYLVGEIWWKDWPYELMEPHAFLGDAGFDAIMNYRWYRNARRYVGRDPSHLNAVRYAQEWAGLNAGVSTEHARAMMNVGASHDAPRTLTSLANDELYKYKAKPNDDPGYIVHRPNEETYRRLKLLLMHQFTFVGAPHIWNGDELGMWGSDDPDCRKPLWWPDIDFVPEVANPFFPRPVPPDSIGPDWAVWKIYQQAIALRKGHPALLRGALEFLVDKHHPDVLAYTRTLGGEQLLVVLNPTGNPQKWTMPRGDWEALWVEGVTLEGEVLAMGVFGGGVYQKR